MTNQAEIITWKNEWGTYKKGQSFTYEQTNSKGGFDTITDKIHYVVQNKYYSLFVLENGDEYVLYSRLWLKQNNNNL
jgi:hypothetical protein